MHFWIDIDSSSNLKLIEKLITGLRAKEHSVLITSIKSEQLELDIKKHNILCKQIGWDIDFYGFMKSPSNLLRGTLLGDYLEGRKIDAAISLGSLGLFYTCVDKSIPVIHLIQDVKESINPLYIEHRKIKFLPLEDIPDQLLVDKKISLDKIANLNSSLTPVRSLQSLINTIESVGREFIVSTRV